MEKASNVVIKKTKIQKDLCTSASKTGVLCRKYGVRMKTLIAQQRGRPPRQYHVRYVVPLLL